MKIDGVAYRTIWPNAEQSWVEVIDQVSLPHCFRTQRLESLDEVIRAIRTMQVRGAPLIGATAAYGIALAMRQDDSDRHLHRAAAGLTSSRPTAVNLRWAVDRMVHKLNALPWEQRNAAAWAEAAAICDEDVQINQSIGKHGMQVITELLQNKQQDAAESTVSVEMQPAATAKLDAGHQERSNASLSTRRLCPAYSTTLNILTHCNAGWLATVDWGTALSPIYAAHDAGLDIHVWVDETRPRNQGGSLTAWELGRHGVPHTVITDNAGGHYMQHGFVDMVIVGADRVTRTGDVCNKIGTYLKALAAFDNQVPFYVAVPSPTIDWTIENGLEQIPIEERGAEEVAWVHGRLPDGSVACVNVLPEGSPAANPAFDVTPAKLVTGIITERGVCRPQELVSLFKD